MTEFLTGPEPSAAAADTNQAPDPAQLGKLRRQFIFWIVGLTVGTVGLTSTAMALDKSNRPTTASSDSGATYSVPKRTDNRGIYFAPSSGYRQAVYHNSFRACRDQVMETSGLISDEDAADAYSRILVSRDPLASYEDAYQGCLIGLQQS